MVIVLLLFSFLSSSPSNRVDHHFNDFLNNFSFIFQIVCPLFLPITWSCASLSNQGSFFFCFRLALLVISNSFTLYLIPNGDVSLGSSWPPISGCLIVSTEEEMSILFVDFVFRINPPPPKKKASYESETGTASPENDSGQSSTINSASPVNEFKDFVSQLHVHQAQVKDDPTIRALFCFRTVVHVRCRRRKTTTSFNGGASFVFCFFFKWFFFFKKKPTKVTSAIAVFFYDTSLRCSVRMNSESDLARGNQTWRD